MGCDPVSITGYVDGELDACAAAALERHMAVCQACAEQAASENELRSRLLALPSLQPWRGLEARLRASTTLAVLTAN
jgi:anti-sigma factor RsiW